MTAFYLLTGTVYAAYALLLLFYFVGWKMTPAFISGNTTLKTKASIILPVRNEEKNIARILHCLTVQHYPNDNYEIIVVDDFSSDTTAKRVQEQAISNLKLIHLADKGGKKQALAEGIRHSTGALIITTDADCEMGQDWLSGIVSCYEKYRPKMIIAPVLLSGERSFQEKMQSQEMTLLTALAGASTFFNAPLLCSGANLAYEKQAFLEVNGFEEIPVTATGDDIFLMLKIHKKFPQSIRYLKSIQATVLTHPAHTTSEALVQRKRWASKTFLYGPSYITAIAILVFLANFLVLISGIVSVINVKFVLALVTTLPVKCIVDFMLFQSASSFFVKKPNLLLFLFSSALYPLYATYIGFTSPFTNYSWKGRKS